MFAVSPNLWVIFPGLADDLLAGRDHIQMPQGATLRFALFAERRARIAGPMGAHRILTVERTSKLRRSLLPSARLGACSYGH